MAENEGQEEAESTNNIQNLIFVPQGCSYFLDTTTDQQHIGLITQSCGPCACIIVRNRNNTKMVLAHVDSGNDITDEEFGLPKWVKQCGNGNNVTVEVHMGCAYNPNVDRKRITDDIKSVRNKLGLSEEQVKINEDKNSQGGMILRNGYKVVTNKTGAEQIQPWKKKIFYKILQNPDPKLDKQISFDNATTLGIEQQKNCQQYAVNIYNTLQKQHTPLNLLENYKKYSTKKVNISNDKQPLIPLDVIGLKNIRTINDSIKITQNGLKNLEYNLLYSLNNKQQLTEYGMIRFSNLQKEKQIEQIMSEMDKNFEYNSTDKLRNSLRYFKNCTTDNLPSKTPQLLLQGKIKKSKSFENIL